MCGNIKTETANGLVKQNLPPEREAVADGWFRLSERQLVYKAISLVRQNIDGNFQKQVSDRIVR